MARALVVVLSGVVILAGAVVVWQRSQLAAIRQQMANQERAQAEDRRRVDAMTLFLGEAPGPARAFAASLRAASAPDAGTAAAVSRTEERRLILDQYEGVLAAMNLPESTSARLKDLLTDRIETVLDAEDAARRAGLAEGSVESTRAVAQAISGLDHEIALLVGLDGMRRLDGSQAPGSAPAPAPATVVTVIVQTAPAAPPPVYSRSVAIPSTPPWRALRQGGPTSLGSIPAKASSTGADGRRPRSGRRWVAWRRRCARPPPGGLTSRTSFQSWPAQIRARAPALTRPLPGALVGVNMMPSGKASISAVAAVSSASVVVISLRAPRGL